MLQIQNLTMGFGGKLLFENVTAKFGEGFRFGVIGANGCGKSTLMKILAKNLEPISGQVSIGTQERQAYLRQDQYAFESQRVLDVVMMGHQEMWACQQEKDAIYANPEASEEDYLKAAQLEAQFAEFGGYTATSRAGELLIGIGIATALHERPMKEVPPGWKLRVLLAQALFAQPDILLLDEPTNHLDIHTISWLENTLNARDGTMLIISHDRHFLNSVCTHIADLDYNTLTLYPGDYDDFMEASALARQRQMAAKARSEDRIAALEEFVRRFRAHKAKAKQATSRMKQIDKIRVEDMKPSSRQYPYVRFNYPDKQKLRRVVLDVKGLSFAWPDQPPLIQKLNLTVEAGERLAIIGQNGIGKTTLLRLLAGELSPTTGTIHWSEKTKIGSLPQESGALFSGDESLVDWLAPHWQPGDDNEPADQLVRATLGRLLFSGDEVKKSVRVLSGGERVRMLLGKLMLQQPNVLLLDEPTNHLDMESIEALNVALENYTGTLILVSHDRELVSSLATRIISMDNKGIHDHKSSYEDYLAGLAA